MKLLNTRTLELEEFLNDSKIPHYAILSHRWRKDELTIRDLKPKYAHSLPSKPGYSKVYNFCKTARQGGFDYGWVDTCCIDKRSSAELSEAINSMFRWYQNAKICYVYMDTVPRAKRPAGVHHEPYNQGWLDRHGYVCDPLLSDRDQRKAFEASEWLLRGWTLQELLAPEHVVFLDRDWTKFGTKKFMAREISAITGIHENFLVDNSWIYGHDAPSVAKKMSWASCRETSREEDMAHCLLGLFNINMPLLYGEGSKAFVRLQEEIIRKLDDESIFVWWDNRSSSLLAPSSKSFDLSRDTGNTGLQAFKFTRQLNRPPYTITNQGLEISGELIERNSAWAPILGRGKPQAASTESLYGLSASIPRGCHQ